MAEYNGQQMNQGYGVGEMGQSPATMQRMQAQHPSPQQQVGNRFHYFIGVF